MKPISLSFSPAQIETIDTLRGDLSRSEYIRRLLATEAAAQGIHWPDDLKPHGDNSRRYNKRWPVKFACTGCDGTDRFCCQKTTK